MGRNISTTSEVYADERSLLSCFTKKHFDRFIGEIPDWLNEEVQDWTSEHAFATADLGVFIYKAMYHEFKN